MHTNSLSHSLTHTFSSLHLFKDIEGLTSKKKINYNKKDTHTHTHTHDYLFEVSECSIIFTRGGDAQGRLHTLHQISVLHQNSLSLINQILHKWTAKINFKTQLLFISLYAHLGTGIVLKNSLQPQFWPNIKVFGVTATVITATFVHNFPQHQGSQWNHNHDSNLKTWVSLLIKYTLQQSKSIERTALQHD